MSDVAGLFPFAAEVGGPASPFAGGDPIKLCAGGLITFLDFQLEGVPSGDVVFFGPICPEQVDTQEVFVVAAHDVVSGFWEHQVVSAVGPMDGEDGFAGPQVLAEFSSEVCRGEDIRLRQSPWGQGGIQLEFIEDVGVAGGDPPIFEVCLAYHACVEQRGCVVAQGGEVVEALDQGLVSCAACVFVHRIHGTRAAVVSLDLPQAEGKVFGEGIGRHAIGRNALGQLVLLRFFLFPSSATTVDTKGCGCRRSGPV